MSTRVYFVFVCIIHVQCVDGFEEKIYEKCLFYVETSWVRWEWCIICWVIISLRSIARWEVWGVWRATPLEAVCWDSHSPAPGNCHGR